MPTLFFFILLSFFSFDAARAEEPPPYSVIEDKARLPILTPDFSDRKVLKIRLSNGLEAYLFSDPKADKSAAALTVKAGSWAEPQDSPGLAHFLEHMLFLGTKKYPQESEYFRYITENGGMANAFTTDSYTSYMFSINNGAFEQALDRFSNFFKEPLFNPSGVARELQAIDQEYAKNIENDDIRLMYVDKELANAEHPYHKFSMGNSASLSKVSQETLVKWFRENYSANLMRLFVYSPLPIEKLKELVIADFQGIPNSNRQMFSTEAPISSDNFSGQMVYVEPVKNTRTLTLSWELPPQFAGMRETRPDRIICHVLGHEGEESLLAYLKKEKLAESLQCGGHKLGKNAMVLYVELGLTDEGVKEVNTVIERIFQAIAGFRQKEFPQYLFDEVQKMATISYQYQPRQDAFFYAMQNASLLYDEPMETFPEHSSIIQKFDPQALKQLFEFLTPKNAHFYLTAPSKLTGVEPDRQEKWLGAHYSIKKIDPALFAKWSEAQPFNLIDLPSPNKLIPQKLSLNTAIESSTQESSFSYPRPKAIVNDTSGVIYFAADTRYQVPKISWIFEIKTPHIDIGCVQDTVLADLYVKSLNEALNKFSYPASLAGLSYEIQRSEYGIVLVLEGYSENAEVLFDEILKKMKDIPTEEQFKVYKELLTRQYQNFEKESPLEQASEQLKSVLYKKFTKEKQKATGIKKITYAKFKDYVNRLFDQTYIEGSLYGNMTEKQALQMVNKLQSNLDGEPYPKGKGRRSQVVILPEKKGPLYINSHTKAQGNAVILAIENKGFSFKEEAAQQILMQAMKGPFFATLRTKQQTGYIVYSNAQEIDKQLFDFFAVQSNTHAPWDLLSRFELFIEGYLQEIPHELTEERFNAVRQALLETLQQPPKTIAEMNLKLRKMAFTYDGDFDWYAKRIQGFKELTYPEFLEFTQSFVGRQNKRRIAILLDGVIPTDKDFTYQPIDSLAELHKLSSYTREK